MVREVLAELAHVTFPGRGLGERVIGLIRQLFTREEGGGVVDRGERGAVGFLGGKEKERSGSEEQDEEGLHDRTENPFTGSRESGIRSRKITGDSVTLLPFSTSSSRSPRRRGFCWFVRVSQPGRALSDYHRSPGIRDFRAAPRDPRLRGSGCRHLREAERGRGSFRRRAPPPGRG